MDLLFALFVLTIVACVSAISKSSSSLGSSTFIGDWGRGVGLQAGPQIPSFSAEGNRLSQPTCVDIPENLTLCHGIGYNKMRIPNLLDHDTMSEVSQQAVSWVPLFNLKCHPDTQLFLCSLFSPVCLDRPIYPCRSLCEAVRKGCEGRMRTYGYPWPDMVRCDKFPVDNDMCIQIQNGGDSGSGCTACKQVDTYENIIDNYCRADIVIKTKMRQLKDPRLRWKKARILKPKTGTFLKNNRKPTFLASNVTSCCSDVATRVGKKGKLLVMGTKRSDGGLVPTFILEWKKTNAFKKAIKMMKNIDCDNPKQISDRMLADSGIAIPVAVAPPAKPNTRSRLRRRKNKPVLTTL